jgi:uncharacterized protein YcnI
MINTSGARRAVVATLAAVAAALVPAFTAHAHVSVSSTDAAPGGFGKLVFRVPSESETANTTSITVNLPADTPFPFVSVQAVPGWTAETVTTEFAEPVEAGDFTLTDAITSVTWTADGDGLAPHEFAEFALSVGPIPDVDQLMFPTTQTYSDGEVVEWAEPTVEGEEEPERPAPVLNLAAAGEADATDGDDGDDGDDSGTANLALVLAIVGIGLGASSLALGLSAYQARRRET